MTHFRQIATPATQAFTYLLADLSGRDAVIIDPQRGQGELLLSLLAERDLRLTLVLRTHVHADPEPECGALCRHTGAELVLGAGAACAGPHRRVQHGEHLVFGDQVLRVLATPGHTAHCVSYLWRDRLFCGDALALRGCGSVDDPGCDPGQLYDSVTQRLFLLADETLVFPGHEIDGRTVSTIAEERVRNPYFANQTRDTFHSMLFGRQGRAAVREAAPLGNAYNWTASLV